MPACRPNRHRSAAPTPPPSRSSTATAPTTFSRPNNTCGMAIRFQPDSPGPKHAELVISNDGSGGTLSIPLEGEGREGPRFSPSTSQALLGDVPLGSSRAQTFTITNTGDYPLYIQQSFLVSGTPLMFPRTSDTCAGRSVEPGSSCEITVLFQANDARPEGRRPAGDHQLDSRDQRPRHRRHGRQRSPGRDNPPRPLLDRAPPTPKAPPHACASRPPGRATRRCAPER